MNKPKAIFTVLSVLVLVGGLVTGLILVRQNQNINEKAAPTTTMYTVPANQSKNAGDNFTFSVDIDTSTNAVTAFDIKMTFDPQVIQIVSLEKGSGASGLDASLANTFDNTAGTLDFGVYTLTIANALNGSSIEVLKINATVKSGAAAGNYNLAFDPATEASATLESQNVLVSKSPGVLTVLGAAASASPSPTAAATAAPEATATAAATASSNAASKPTVTIACSGTTPVATITWTGGVPDPSYGFTANIFEYPFAGNYYNKNVGDVHTSNSAGFIGTSDSPLVKGQALVLEPGKTYAANIWNGVKSPDSDPFTVSSCGTGLASNLTSSPTPTPATTQNSCGGTCGSNFNCKSDLICYNGYCRNPSCTSVSNCTCTVSNNTSGTSATPAPPTLPNSGVDWPTVAGAGIGIFALFASILIAL